MSVVPVSTMPAVVSRMGAPLAPYVASISIPQNDEAGDVRVMGAKLISPVNSAASGPPKESEPYESPDEMGLKDTPRTAASMLP